ncbi:zinc ribbon domain-containing protein [Adlercreutzia sp. ZJ138]|uniref:zinc ribbon domain-containing protein n=1 Tax=Adlercreutzia sp. ZJ138 TaxID=2709405 RepID=UPI0013EB71A9|nr:hypothetical protein [Adlercreutzia sp. ZJ138]
MRVATDDLAKLLILQQVDLGGLAAQKQLDELPQRAIIADCRKKKQVLNAKLDKLAELASASEDEISRIGEEDAKLAQKQQRLQQEIDAVKGDFRSVGARTKELNGAAKRRATLDEKLTQAYAELEKIDAVITQAREMMQDVVAKEEAATAEFVKKGSALKEKCAKARAERAAIVTQLPAELVCEYEKVAARSGGVAVGRLNGSSCGVCRNSIDAGRLVAMKAEGNVAACPHCKRLLVL